MGSKIEHLQIWGGGCRRRMELIVPATKKVSNPQPLSHVVYFDCLSLFSLLKSYVYDSQHDRKSAFKNALIFNK